MDLELTDRLGSRRVLARSRRDFRELPFSPRRIANSCSGNRLRERLSVTVESGNKPPLSRIDVAVNLRDVRVVGQLRQFAAYDELRKQDARDCDPTRRDL